MTFDRSRAIRALDKATLALAEVRMILAAEDEAPADPVAEAEENLRHAAAERGHVITPDGYIREADAADLLGRSPHTLRGWRNQHRPVEFRRFLGRVEYAIAPTPMGPRCASKRTP